MMRLGGSLTYGSLPQLIESSLDDFFAEEFILKKSLLTQKKVEKNLVVDAGLDVTGKNEDLNDIMKIVRSLEDAVFF